MDVVYSEPEQLSYIKESYNSCKTAFSVEHTCSHSIDKIITQIKLY